MGRCQQEILAGCRLPDPPGIPAQFLLRPPWPEDPEPDLAASQPQRLDEPPDADPHVRWC